MLKIIVYIIVGKILKRSEFYLGKSSRSSGVNLTLNLGLDQIVPIQSPSFSKPYREGKLWVKDLETKSNVKDS